MRHANLDGTVYVDGEALPGPQAFITECLAAGCLVSYITNLSLFNKAHCLDALERIGMATTPRHVLTAVYVLMTTLDGRARGRRIAVLAADHVRERLRIAGHNVTDPFWCRRQPRERHRARQGQWLVRDAGRRSLEWDRRAGAGLPGAGPGVGAEPMNATRAAHGQAGQCGRATVCVGS